MRRMREDHLHRNYSDVNERPIRCRAKLIQPKAGMAARLAMIPSAYNGTFCPATAASNGGSSERSSEGLDSRWALPGAGSFNRPTVREVMSNRTEQKKISETARAAPYLGRRPCFFRAGQRQSLPAHPRSTPAVQVWRGGLKSGKKNGGDNMMIQAVLSNPSHPEYGVATIPFPIGGGWYV